MATSIPHRAAFCNTHTSIVTRCPQFQGVVSAVRETSFVVRPACRHSVPHSLLINRDAVQARGAVVVRRAVATRLQVEGHLDPGRIPEFLETSFAVVELGLGAALPVL